MRIMVLGMNTIAFGDEIAEVETADDVAVEAEIITADEDAEIDSIEKDVTDAKRDDVTNLVWARVIDDKWSVYSDPATWSTADYIVSVNNIDADDDPYDASNNNYKAYNPIYYYLEGWNSSTDGDEHLVDGKQVEKTKHEGVDTDPSTMLHRVIDVGNGYYLLVGYEVGNRDYDNYEMVSNTYDKDGKHTGTETHRVNNYYNGEANNGADSEMVVDYVPGKKIVRGVWKKKGNNWKFVYNKKTEEAWIDGKAVLVKYEGSTVTPVSEVIDFNDDDIQVSAKNNDAASISKNSYYDGGELYSAKMVDGKINYTFNGYKTIYPKLEPKKDNAFLKGQPYFTISVKDLESATGTKADDKAVKKLKGAVNKALKKEKFNFEIARLSIGDASKDYISQFSYESAAIEGTVSQGEINDYNWYKNNPSEEAKKKLNTKYGNAAAAAEKEYAEMYWNLRKELGNYLYNNRSEIYSNYTTEEEKNEFLDLAIVSDNALGRSQKTSYSDEDKDGNTILYHLNCYFTGNIGIASYVLKNDTSVKAYVSAVADQLAAKSGGFSCDTTATDAILDTSNEKGKTLLTMDKKGKYKLNSLVFADPYIDMANSTYYDRIAYNVDKDDIVDRNPDVFADEGVLLYNIKKTYTKVKVGTKAGGKTDVYYEQKEAEKAANTAEFTNCFIIVHGQNNFEDACTMRLKELGTEDEWISVGNYVDDNFYYVASEEE